MSNVKAKLSASNSSFAAFLMTLRVRTVAMTDGFAI